MTLRTDIETAFATYGAASVIEELVLTLRHDANLLADEYPRDVQKKLKLADKLADTVDLARSIQN